jgi:hypothetical protein
MSDMYSFVNFDRKETKTNRKDKIHEFLKPTRDPDSDSENKERTM